MLCYAILCYALYVGVVLLHASEALGLPAPRHLPDLYPALFALFGCCNLLWYYVFFVHWMLSEDDDAEEEGEEKRKEKVA